MTTSPTPQKTKNISILISITVHLIILLLLLYQQKISFSPFSNKRINTQPIREKKPEEAKIIFADQEPLAARQEKSGFLKAPDTSPPPILPIPSYQSPIQPDMLAEQQTKQQSEKTIDPLPSRATTPEEPPLISDTKTSAKTAPPAATPTSDKPIPLTKPIAKKPSLSLAQLTKGFTDHLNNRSGDSAVTIRGDKNKQPTAEQLKLERYLAKLSNSFYQSLRAHNTKRPRSEDTFTRNPIIFLSLTRDGIIQHIQISRSSGNTALDNFFIVIFKDASHSFPPVPSYLALSSLPLHYEILLDEKDPQRFLLQRS